MFIKWIVCEVADDKKQAFSKAQEKWKEIVVAKGFLAQTGGWDIDNQGIACVISFWEKAQNLDFFMKNIHDKIFNGNKQADTYQSINISHFTSKMEMREESSSLKEAVLKGRLLRVADCIVKPGKTVHFEKVQRDMWIPGMKNSEGMLGGIFSEEVHNSNRYLVSTFWDSEINHTKYFKSMLPVLQKKADIKSDLENISGRKISLVDSWKVVQ